MHLRLAIAVSLSVAAGGTAASLPPSQDWPSFRGRRASGVQEGHATATTWNVEKGEGVRFRVQVPGLAHSSPVVWGDSVYLTSAISNGEAPLKVGLYGDIDPVPNEGKQRFVGYRLDKRTGEVRWERTAHEGEPRRPRHTKSTHANATPATDGRRVVAWFGSEGLYAYDTEGKLLWKKDLGPLDAAFFRAPDAQWGVASSPVLHQGVVYLQVDVLNEPFLAQAYTVETGASKIQLEAMLTNVEMARKKRCPMCQDTGILTFFVTVGIDFPHTGTLKQVIEHSVARATLEIPLRPNTVDPMTSTNHGDNLGSYLPHILWDFKTGDDVHITTLPKGSGSENMSALAMLSPGAGLLGVKQFVLQL